MYQLFVRSLVQRLAADQYQDYGLLERLQVHACLALKEAELYNGTFRV